MPHMSDVLSTERLELSVLTIADAVSLHVVFSDPAHTIGDGPVTDPDVTLRWLARRERLRAATGLTWYGVRLRGGESLIGTAGVFRGRTGDDPEIGFEIHAPHRGARYASEAVGAVLTEAERVGLSVWATVRAWNLASLRVLEKNHFQRVDVEDDPRGPLIYLSRRAGG